MDKSRLLLLLLFVSSCFAARPLIRRTRQLPRLPFIDAIFARLQGRPPAATVPQQQSRFPQQSRPPQLEGGFTPLGSANSPSGILSSGVPVAPEDGRRPTAFLADLTFQSLASGQREADRTSGNPRPPAHLFPQQGVRPPIENVGRPGPFAQGDGRRRPPPSVELGLPAQGPSHAPPPPSFQQQQVPLHRVPQFVFRRPASDLENDLEHVRNHGSFSPPDGRIPPPAGFQQSAPQHGDSTSSASSATGVRKATLVEVLSQDCEGFEEKGFCESPQRYPTAQVVALMNRCSRILDALYVPVPDSNAIPPSSPLVNKKRSTLERANHGIWSWAEYSGGRGNKGSVCSSDARRASPSYARDVTGKWVVVLQHDEGNMRQKVAVEVCDGVHRPCLSEPHGRSRVGTRCVQRRTHHHLVAWDPENPDECPSLRVFSFPTACLCHFTDA